MTHTNTHSTGARYAPLTPTQQATNMFGRVLASITTTDAETLFAIERSNYSGSSDNRFMTIRHHENGAFYWGHYDITHAAAMYELIKFADTQFNPLHRQPSKPAAA